MSEVKNKCALITGGSKGIGLFTAKILLENNMKVAITGRSQKSLDEAIQFLGKDKSEDILAIVSDVRDKASLESAVADILKAWGQLDVLIANAGIGHFAPIDLMTDEQWSETMDNNLTGVFNSVKACLDPLKKSKGYIITIASLAGTNFFANGSAYNASKFGLVGFTQAIMLDLRKYGIKVSTIMPGSVSTHFNNHVPSEDDQWKIQPEDIGQMVIDLLHMNPRTLPSKIEVRPSIPPSA